jgi:hypothetical protein
LLELSASCVGVNAANALLESDLGSLGRIVAAFPNSFYIRTFREDLILVTNRQLRSPITVNLSSNSDLGQAVRPLAAVSYEANSISIGDSANIDLNLASQYDNTMDSPDSDMQGLVTGLGLLCAGSTILRIIDTRFSLLDPASLAHDRVRDFVANAIIPLRESGNHELFAKGARRIVGLGAGYTPSGDDLLGGFLAIYNSLGRRTGRDKLLLDLGSLEGRTGWVSAKLLDYMQRQVLDEQLDRLIHSATTGNENEFVMALQTLLPRGHTSGIDIAVGVILGLSTVNDLTMNITETSAIAKRLGL